MNLFDTVVLASSGDTAASSAGGMGFVPILSMALVLAIMYFMMIRPQRKREKEERAMRDALKVGDKVVTIGGICGKVVKMKDNHVFIETGSIGTEAQKSTIKLERDAIKTVEKKQTN